MPIEVASAPGLPEPDGPFAPATLASGTRMLSISGQVAHDSDGELVGGNDIVERTRQTLRNLDALVTAGGAAQTDIARLTVYPVDIGDLSAVARVRADYFGDHKPASTLVEVSALAFLEPRVEIDAVCVY